MAPTISCDKLTKVFRGASGRAARFFLNRPASDVLAVSDVTFTAQPGEVLGIMGPNGAGKTTLVKMLCTLLLPTSGTAQVCGSDVSEQAATVRSLISYVTGEERSFYWRLTGLQNLHFFAGLLGLDRDAASRRINDLAGSFGLDEILEKRFDTFSTGNRQKLAIVRGLLNEANVLFLDEPTRSLDPNSSATITSLLRDRIAHDQNKTVVFVTHRLDEALATCDRLIVMNRGRCVFLGPPGQMTSGGSDAGWRITLQGSLPDASASLAQLTGVTFSVYHSDTPEEPSDQAHIPPIALNVRLDSSAGLCIGDIVAALAASGVRVTGVEPLASSAAEAFSRLTGELPEDAT